MLVTSISFVILLVSVLTYFKLADKFNIIDKPNQRSSHSYVTIRGGGIVFTLAAMLWYLVYGFQQPYLILSLLAISLISFLDDVMELSNRIRIAVHFLAVGVLFWQLQVFSLPWYLAFATFIIIIGWINAFNFMDGINGITATYSLVALSTLLWLISNNEFLPFPQVKELLILLILSVVIFSFFNMRKRAKCFAGDVGSVGMAFMLAWLFLSLVVQTGRLEYLLFVSVYGIDTVITIIYRLQRRENIFKAHRTHLYQYLSNEMNISHIMVSWLFGGVQLFINVLTLFLFSKGLMTISIMVFIMMILSLIYFITRYYVVSSIHRITE